MQQVAIFHTNKFYGQQAMGHVWVAEQIFGQKPEPFQVTDSECSDDVDISATSPDGEAKLRRALVLIDAKFTEDFEEKIPPAAGSQPRPEFFPE